MSYCDVSSVLHLLDLAPGLYFVNARMSHPTQSPVTDQARTPSRVHYKKAKSPSLLSETYRILPIAARHILSIWKSITRAAIRDKNYYAHGDAFFLADILRHMQLDLAYSRVKIIGNSGDHGSIVYGISPGYPCSSDSNNQSNMKLQSTAHFVIKVHQDRDRGSNEMEILRLLKGCQYAAKYVIGLFTSTCIENSSSYVEFEAMPDNYQIPQDSSDMASSTSSNPNPDTISKRSSLPVNLPFLDFLAQGNLPKRSVDLKFSLQSLRKTATSTSTSATKVAMNERLSEGACMEPADVWWEFNATRTTVATNGSNASGRHFQSKESSELSRSSAGMADGGTASRTAVLMHKACARNCVTSSYDIQGHLDKQLIEIHDHHVFHTDIRFTNVLPFEIDTDEEGNRIVREYIVDFDLAVKVNTGDKFVEIDISQPGARRDLALEVARFPADSVYIKRVQWSGHSDSTALQIFIQTLSASAAKKRPRKSTSVSSMNGLPSVNLSKDLALPTTTAQTPKNPRIGDA